MKNIASVLFALAHLARGQNTPVSAPAAVPSQVSLPSEDLSTFCSRNASNLAILNGESPQGGCVQSIVQGAIPNVANMVSTLITSPENGARIQAGVNFNVLIDSVNLDIVGRSGFLSSPQVLNARGIIQGTRFLTVQNIGGGQIPPPASGFEQFLEVRGNQATVNRLAAGSYRICTLTASQSGQPVIMPVAQRGGQDDCIRIIVQ
jgi:hypothetical protein